MPAYFPSSLASLRTNYADTSDIVYAAMDNQISLEINAIEAVLGTNVLTSSWAATWNSVTTSWSDLSTRLRNIEAGLTRPSPTSDGSTDWRKITVSTSAPSGGADGDVWLVHP